MKKALLSAILITTAVITYAQNYYMTGVFVNHFPTISGIDSTSFTFTATGYSFYINGAANPTSSGTYQIKNGPNNEDTLVLTENSGACLNNGGSNPIKFKALKNSGTQNYLYLYETTQSQTSCSVFSNKIAGEYQGTTGQFMNGGVGINQVSAAYQLSVYPNPIRDKVVLKYTVEEEQAVAIYITDIQGRKIMEVSEKVHQSANSYTREIALPEALASGTYLLCISGNKGIVTIRLTK